MLKYITQKLAAHLKSRNLTQEDKLLIESLATEDRMEEPLAYAALLVELAMCDGEFSEREELVVVELLKKFFPKLGDRAAILTKSAVTMVKTFRGPSSFVERIKNEYSRAERAELTQAIDSVIAADSQIDAMELHLRDKFKKLLE